MEALERMKSAVGAKNRGGKFVPFPDHARLVAQQGVYVLWMGVVNRGSKY